MGQLVFQATLGGQVNLIGPNTASTFNINVPATSGNMVTTGDTGTVTTTMLASTTGSGAVVLATSPTLVTPALGTPSALVGTNITGTAAGLSIGGNAATATTATNVSGGTSSVTSETVSGNLTLSGGTANGVAYLNGSKVVTTGSALVFDGTNLGLGVTPSAWSASVKALQVSPRVAIWGDAAQSIISHNMYTGGGDKYIGSGFASLFTQINGAFQFLTAPSGTAGNAITFTQAMTLDSSGNLLVGTTSTSVSSGGIYNRAVSSGGSSIIIGHQSGVANGNSFAEFQYAGTLIGSITQSGTTAVLYNLTSDQRLKTNIVDAAPASALIDAIQVRQYDWKSDGSHQRYGFIAQELVAVAPEAVHQPADPEEMMAVDYSKLVPMLVKEIQSLRARVAQLESK